MTHTLGIVIGAVVGLIALAVWKHLRGIMDATRVTERQQETLRRMMFDDAICKRCGRQAPTLVEGMCRECYLMNFDAAARAALPCIVCGQEYRTDRPLEEVMELHKKKCQGAKQV